jgi:predicted HicB family RNase H-like nuclease
MSAVKGRVKRPQGAATVPMQVRVPESVRNAARAAADGLGISMAAYIEALMLADAEQHFVRPAQEYRQEAISA